MIFKKIPGLYGIVLAMPAAAACILIFLFFSSSIYDFIPAWSDGDEIDYWHQILTFAHKSFGGGYYTIEELTPKAGFTHFGTHGPAFPVLFGLAAKVAGWQLHSPVIFNLSAVTAALLFFLYAARPGRAETLALMAALALFFPLHLYLPSAMQESLHHSLAIMLAPIFHRLTAIPCKGQPLFAIFSGLMIAGAALLRPTWAILFIPFLAFAPDKPSRRTNLAALLLGSGMAVIIYMLYSHWAAPYPDNFLYGIFAGQPFSLTTALDALAAHSIHNLQQFFSFSESKWFELVQRGVAGVILFYSFYRLSGLHRTAPARNECRSDLAEKHVLLLIAFAIAGMMSLNLTLYEIDGSREYRIMAPYLLFSLLLLSLRGHFRVIAVVTAINCAALPAFFQTYRESHQSHFIHPNAKIELNYFRNSLASGISHKQGGAPWQNSLLIDVADYSYLLTALPPGIGINAVMSWDRIHYPLKSAYLLISPERAKQLAEKTRLVPVATNGLRTVYLNLDSPASDAD